VRAGAGDAGSVSFFDLEGDGEVVGEAVGVDGFAHAAERDRLGVVPCGGHAGEADDFDCVGSCPEGRGVGSQVLVDQELVQQVGLVVEVVKSGRFGGADYPFYGGYP
jgi:hypothetical protein